MRSSITSLPATLGLVFLLFGCKTTEEQHPAQTGTARSDGYSLLHILVSKQKDVSKLLIVKREQADVRELIQEIARVTGDAEKQLTEFAKSDPTLNLKLKPLPPLEEKTRSSIQSAETKELLRSSGQQFELRLLLSQAQGLSYGSHLAKSLHEQETDIRRKAFLESFARDTERLREQVVELLSHRMQTK